MIKREAKFSILFRHWLKKNPMEDCSFEMKDTRGKDYLAFSEVKEAQINWGRAIKSNKGTLIRITAISEGMPDYCYFNKANAYIVIKYPSCWVMIDIDEFQKENASSARRSLLVSRAREIATIVV